MSDQLEQVQETPIVVYVVQTVSILTSLSYALEALGTLTMFRKLSILAILCTIAICLLTSGFSLSVWRGVGSRRSVSRRYVLNYLWFMALIHPVITVMRSFGAFAPAPHLQNELLFGAALGEMARYPIFLGLLIWAGRSNDLRNHLATGPAQPDPSVGVEPV
jgi:hypothetical protein